MRIPGRALPAVGALLAVALLAILSAFAGPASPAEAREARPLFRLPWSGPAKPARKPRRASKPSAASAARKAAPRPAPAPEAAIRRAAPQAPPPTPGFPAIAPKVPPADDMNAPEEVAAADRAAGFAALRPSPPRPPFLPLPDPNAADEAIPAGPVAAGVPLPPAKQAAPDAQLALLPRSPLDGPPLPGPPDADTPPPVVAPPPSARENDPDCRKLAADGVAIVKPLPTLLGPGSCGAPLPVELSGVRLKDGSVVAIAPAAILRCEIAGAIAAFVAEDLAPAAGRAGETLASVKTAAAYVCRGRNNRVFAKMSEHGLANALDVSGFGFKAGGEFGVYDAALPSGFSAAVKSGACARFATVLGPGSDGFHEDHLHVDMRRRRGANSRLCRWPGS